MLECCYILYRTRARFPVCTIYICTINCSSLCRERSVLFGLSRAAIPLATSKHAKLPTRAQLCWNESAYWRLFPFCFQDFEAESSYIL